MTEGSETAIAWNATFSSRTGVVEAASQERITIRRKSDGHRYTWRVPPGQIVVVSPGCEVHENQVIASAVPPFPVAALRCPGSTPASHIGQLLQSRERTLRFSGVKLARLRGDASFCDEVSAPAADADEDVYVRLEAASYLASTCGQPADPLFRPYYTSNAPQTQLESVIALGEAGTSDAIGLVSAIWTTNSARISSAARRRGRLAGFTSPTRSHDLSGRSPMSTPTFERKLSKGLFQ